MIFLLGMCKKPFNWFQNVFNVFPYTQVKFKGFNEYFLLQNSTTLMIRTKTNVGGKKHMNLKDDTCTRLLSSTFRLGWPKTFHLGHAKNLLSIQIPLL